jgi:Mg-chelatase subunit ChlD
MKFALHNYAGQPVRFFTVEAQDVTPDPSAAAAAPSHHIAILDVSGSMWGDLDSVKSIIEKVFTTEEFNDPAMKVSLITYSSAGDCRVHFQKVTVENVLAPNSPHLAEIRNLRVRGLTGISQALVQAEQLIDDAEVTAISLHTDGYANDPSPYSEAQSIVKAVEAIERHPNAFCNTVGYRSWCDFALLAAVANRLSGKSMQASNAREVYKALHDTQALLAGQMSPVIEAGIGQFDFITFVSKKAEKVLGGTASLTVRGLSGDDDATVYRYKEVDEQTYASAPGPVCKGLDEPLLAFCKANISLGNLNTAKFAMVSTRIEELVTDHSRALVAAEVVEMAADVEKYLFASGATYTEMATPGLNASGPSILLVLSILNTFPQGFRVNQDDLAKGYQRRGLKRVPGSRDKADPTTIIPPTHKLKTERSTDPFVAVSGIDINRDTATVNIRLVEGGTLIETATGNVVEEVAGIKLDLKSYRNYTLVGDGRVNVGVLPIKISDKRLFGGLKDKGLVSGDFDPNAQYDLKLADLPLVDYDQDFDQIVPDLFDELAKLTVLQKILSGLTAGTSEALTAEQIAALKDCYISPALYFSPPTTVPYDDLKDALSKGEVDTYLSYKVKFGTPEITNIGKLKSGNAYLQRRFDLTLADGTKVEKPTLADWWQDGSVWSLKSLSARTKLDEVDALTHPIYEGFLGLGARNNLGQILVQAGWDAGDLHEFEDALDGGLDADEALGVFKSALRSVGSAIDTLYENHITPLAFYIGATGLVPDSFGKAMTADQLVEKYPAVKLAKAEKEGTFYTVPGTDMILGVFTEAEHFTTERGLEAAKAIQA